MTEVQFHPEADGDYRSAYAWYHEKGEQLAQAFEAAVDRAMSQIANAPHRFGQYDERHRQYLLRRFPYSIVYRFDATQVVIVAVAHAKRRPGYWRSRSE
jgi:plasmid stabilization system protein ParE